MSQWKLVPSEVCKCFVLYKEGPLVWLPTISQGSLVFFPKQTDMGFGKEYTIPTQGLMQIGALQPQIHNKGIWNQLNLGQVGKCSCIPNTQFYFSPRPSCVHRASAPHSVYPLAALCAAAAAFQVSYLTWEDISLPVPSSSTWFQFGRSLVARHHLLRVILFHISGKVKILNLPGAVLNVNAFISDGQPTLALSLREPDLQKGPQHSPLPLKPLYQR